MPGQGRAAAVALGARLPPAPAPSPPERGLAETVLVRDGQVLELADHAERLERSWWELYRERPPVDVRGELRAVRGRPAAGVAPGAPGGAAAGPGADVVRAGAAALATRTRRGRRGAGALRGGRRDAAARTRRLGIEPEPLAVVVDPDGTVLQATGANVLAVVGGVVWTPPLDGRIVPGVTRAVVLDLAVDAGVPVRTAPLALDVARGADGVLLVDAAARGAVGAVRVRQDLDRAGRRRCGAGRRAAATAGVHSRCPCDAPRVRLSEFWTLVDDEFGPAQGRTLVRDHVLGGAGPPDRRAGARGRRGAARGVARAV